jgi:hypothetical protein
MDAGAMRGNLLNSHIEPNSPFPPLILKPSGLLVSPWLIILGYENIRNTRDDVQPPGSL